MYDSLLPAGYTWTGLAMGLQATGTALLMDPALAPVLYYVHSLHPHLYSQGDTPVNLYEHCRKLVSHDGYLFDLELGIDPTNYLRGHARARLDDLKNPDNEPLSTAWTNSALTLMLLLMRVPMMAP
ncbi:unnamed protein product [Prorocentrum cordatum]|uniref:Uncharacterized protein n=1 Tax=Prorocentrum cordatum TaxID=2364126 RepID=A0ABN9PIW7_9DINO|nr:unnamed protein product [Polarella glacialis]